LPDLRTRLLHRFGEPLEELFLLLLAGELVHWRPRLYMPGLSRAGLAAGGAWPVW
jgi:hypothetical protein